MNNLFIKKLLFLLLISLNSVGQDGKFTFTISSPVSTSAGVFKNDSVLIKTLWNTVDYTPGTYTKYWDGTDDYGNVIKNPDAIYKVKVLTNNVQYTWQGTVGNSSDSMTGLSKHRGYYNCMKGLAFGPTYGYFCTGYSERSPSLGKFNIATPNQKINPFFTASTSTPNIDYVATDGIKVYWGAFDANNSANTFVFATKVSDDAEVTFPSGVPVTVNYIRTFPSAISNLRQSNSLISGLAVQKTGNYLFVVRSGLNQLQVLNKTTGALIKTLTYTKPRSISVDANDNLWMVTGINTVAKYTVNANGTLTSATITLAGLLDPLATQVSTDGTLVTVADGNTSQQVKFFSNATGAPKNTLGVAGGYATDATVNDNKFYFNDLNGNKLPFIAYQSNGSFWVSDPGNFRVQHYNSNMTYINRVMSLGSSYAVYVDKNNINKVFRNFLEFDIDYSVQTLTGSAGWKLKKNWGATASSAIYNSLQYGPIYINTLSNGRTYGFVNKGAGCELIEFGQNNQLRFTGILTNNTKKILCSDGSLQEYTTSGSTGIFKRYPLTGFDGSGNPLWSLTAEILATAQIDNVAGNPAIFPKSQVFSPTTNKIVLYNYHAALPNTYTAFPSGTPAYHLGLMQRGTNDTYLFQTEKSTTRNYQGPYPGAGWFDIGNGVGDGAGGNVNIIDRNIVTSYHGEFWKGAQSNKYNHYYDDGLAIGQFGTTRPDVGGYGVPAAAKMAGNALTPTLVKDSNGDLYLWHGDESDHAGIHRWKISGLNTIAEQVYTVPFPSVVMPAPNYVDLMAGLPFSQVLKNNTFGWTRNPVADTLINGNTDNWMVSTNVLKFDRQTGVDLYVRFSKPAAQTFNLSRDLGINTVSKSWKISGNISFITVNGHANGYSNNAYLEVLDANGKALATFYASAMFSSTIVTKVFGNTAPILSITEPAGGSRGSALMGGLQPFDIAINNGVVTFNYAGNTQTTSLSDATGNWRTPKTLRIKFVSLGTVQNYNVRYDVSDLRFYKDYSVSTAPNQSPVANAGTDKTCNLPSTNITVNGNGTDADGTISSYGWTKISGPSSGTITSSTNSTTTVNNLAQGVYQYELKVTDNNGSTGKDTVQVTVNAAPNQSPVANAGTDQSITLPLSNTTVSGNGTDADGTIGIYGWTKIAGPSAGTITTPAGSTTTVSNLTQGVYQYELKVTDNNGSTGKDTVQVTVNAAPNQAPVANAGINKIITLPLSNTILAGIGTDADGKISSYGWVKISGPSFGIIASAKGATTVVNNLIVRGIYVFELTVTDNNGSTGKDTVQITVNVAPVANAGTNKTITLPINSATLTGTGADAESIISNFNWLKISGPASGTIVSPKGSTTVVNNLAVKGVYIYELTVTDSYGVTGKDTVQVTVNAAANQSPVANAGTNKIITLPLNNATLTGIGTDADGKISSYGWTKISGPSFGTISSSKGATTAVNNLMVRGIYVFEFTVTDNNGATGKDTVQVTVNVAPVANAGINKTITLPLNYTTLTGAGTDAESVISNFNWIKISGPASATITSPKGSTTVVNNLAAKGVYMFELTVTDSYGVTGKDTVQVTVNAANNQSPIANAGTNKIITLPTNNTTLTGIGTDADGTISTYAWVKISGPSGGTIATGTKAITSINNLIQGVYNYELSVTDNNGVKGKDTIQVTVNPIINSASVASSRVSSPNSIKLQVYPNPVSGVANLNITSTTSEKKIHSISVVDVTGKLVQYKELATSYYKSLPTLDMSGLRDGYYILTVKFEDGQNISTRFIKYGGK